MLLMRRAAHVGARGASAARSLLQRLYRAFDQPLRARAPRLHAGAVGAAGATARLRARCSSPSASLSCLLVPVLGRDFFPSVDAGQIRLHMRAPTGTRIEETARIADAVEAAIRELIPPDQLETILDNLGRAQQRHQPVATATPAPSARSTARSCCRCATGHRPTERVRHAAARASCPSAFRASSSSSSRPTSSRRSSTSACRRRSTCSSPAPTSPTNAALAGELTQAIRQIPGAVDAHVHQRLDAPAVDLQMDRTRLQQVGLTAANVGQNVLISLSGSSQTAPAFWLNPQNGVVYNIAVQTPQYQRRFARRAAQHAGGHGAGAAPPAAAARSCSATWSRPAPAPQPPVVSRYNILPAIDVYVSVQGTDLASVAARGARSWSSRCSPSCRAAARSRCAARCETMQASFVGLGVGLAMAIVLVYLLIVVNFQSWIDAADHHRRAAGRAGRHRLDAVHHRHHAQRAGADRRDHDDGRGHRQQHPGGLVRAPAPRRRRRRRCRPRSTPAPPASARC